MTVTTKEDEKMEKTRKAQRCLVRYIDPGQSDSVIYISPAEHTDETVDLTNQAGMERKEEIDRIIHLHAPRVGIIPRPAKLMDGDGGVGGGPNLRNRTLADEDIPEIRLEGFIFPKPKVTAPKRLPAEAFKGDVAMTNNRMDKMEKNIDMLTTTIGALNNVISNLTLKPSAGKAADNTNLHTGPETTTRGPGVTTSDKKVEKGDR